MANGTKKKTCVAIVPAAGTSSRMKAHGDKLFTEIAGVPVIVRTLRALESSQRIDEIIITTREDMIAELEALCKANLLFKVSTIIPGGNTRAESVLNGVIKAGDRFDLIAIHDAARPFVTHEVIDSAIEKADIYGACAPAVAVKDTIKVAEDGVVANTVPRDTLNAIQTPQVFDSELIRTALTKAVNDNLPITDDCSAVELFGGSVYLSPGDYFNIKITTPEDLIFAEAIAKQTDIEVTK